MDPRVTAIVVAGNGGKRLERTLAALSEQTRLPDAIVAIDCASTDDTAAILASYGPTQLIAVPEKLPFGSAIATAVRVVPPTQSDDDWLWLLAQDTAPEPDALELLLATAEVSPSVGIAGPKLVDWEDRTFIRELGETMTPFGASVTYVEDELDQAQHDGLSDVLGVGPAGMLVRQTLWERLGGFDPGLPAADDGLDFCVRARLAGHRVTLVPTARVATAGDGVAGPSRSPRARARIHQAADRRRAQLHRRMVYAAAGLTPLHWLSLVPLAFLRSVGRLVGKQPALIGGEFSAAFRVAFSGIRVAAARRALARNRTVGWAAIAPLRIPLSEARRARVLKRELLLSAARGERRQLDFFSGGGAWVCLAMLILGIVAFFPLLNAQAVAGGGFLPLSQTAGEVWRNAAFGWRQAGLGFTGPADPFSAVLAVVASLTFWQPSSSLVILYFAALPASAMGAWLLAARLTDRRLPRLFAATAWALSPSLLAAMQTGRPAAILAHILLPWLFFAGLTASRSWAATATTALIGAAVAACSPSLVPALAIVWVAALVIAGRRAGRLVFLIVPALALFAPLVWVQGARGAWLSLLADPGVPVASAPVHSWSLALGSPLSSASGWASLLSGLGLRAPVPELILPILLVPIAVLAVLSLFVRGSTTAMACLGVALLGFATAVGASSVSVQVAGTRPAAIWPGAGVSLYWLGIVFAATIALSTLGRFAIAPAWIASLALAAAIVPAAFAVPLGSSAIHSGSGQTLPAVVTADASTHARVGTLVLTPQPDGAVTARLVRGTGDVLDAQSTLNSTLRSLGSGQRSLATLAGNLVSQSGMDESAELDRLGIGYVLLTPAETSAAATAADAGSASTTTAAAQQTAQRGRSALDGNSLLTAIGATPDGTLWSYRAGRAPTPPAAEIPPNAGAPLAGWITAGQLVVIAVTLLLAVPVGGSNRRIDPIVPSTRPVRRRRRRDRTATPPAGSDDSGAPVPEAEVEAESAAPVEWPDEVDDRDDDTSGREFVPSVGGHDVR